MGHKPINPDPYVAEVKRQVKEDNQKIKQQEERINRLLSSIGKLEFENNKLKQEIEDKSRFVEDNSEGVRTWTIIKKDGAYQALEYVISRKRVVDIIEHEPNIFPIVKHQVMMAVLLETQDK